MQTGLSERKAELGGIDALLALAQAGSGDMLLITGPAGIGKSVLLGVARERARLAGMRVLSGSGRELEGGFSFGVARQLFEPLLAGAGEIERDALLAGAAHRALTALEGESGHPHRRWAVTRRSRWPMACTGWRSGADPPRGDR